MFSGGERNEILDLAKKNQGKGVSYDELRALIVKKLPSLSDEQREAVEKNLEMADQNAKWAREAEKFEGLNHLRRDKAGAALWGPVLRETCQSCIESVRKCMESPAAKLQAHRVERWETMAKAEIEAAKSGAPREDGEGLLAAREALQPVCIEERMDVLRCQEKAYKAASPTVMKLANLAYDCVLSNVKDSSKYNQAELNLALNKCDKERLDFIQQFKVENNL